MANGLVKPAGGYILLLPLAHAGCIQVGKLGSFDFPSAHYLYFGSALGGLAPRINRHQSPGKKLHWHIDYLTAIAQIERVWWAAGRQRWECLWAHAALAIPGVVSPAVGFGSSDCRCSSHLVQASSPCGALGIINELPGNLGCWP